MAQETLMHERRLERGWTCLELAERCAKSGVSVSESQIGRIERGIYAPRPKLRAVLAKLLDLDAAHDFPRKVA